jgi:hypothetical protein
MDQNTEGCAFVHLFRVAQQLRHEATCPRIALVISLEMGNGVCGASHHRPPRKTASGSPSMMGMWDLQQMVDEVAAGLAT